MTAVATREEPAEFWREWARTDPPWTRPGFLHEALRPGQSSATSLSADQMRAVLLAGRELDPGRLPECSAALAPMPARGEAAGVLAVIRLSAEPFDRRDLRLVRELADRGGLALANAQLFAEQHRLLARSQAVLDTAGEAIITIDDHGVIQTVNRAGLALFGYREGALAGQNVTVLMPAPYRDDHDRQLARYLSHRRAPHHREGPGDRGAAARRHGVPHRPARDRGLRRRATGLHRRHP